tara:strand:- start:225 stop:392 length:168 start_codon:yes stop_codon:yes gene_type:complete
LNIIQDKINFINNKNSFSSKIISNNTIKKIYSTIKKVYFYKDNTQFSDIVFFEKN